MNSSEPVELSSINKAILVQVSFRSNTGSIRERSFLDLQEEQFKTDRAMQYE